MSIADKAREDLEFCRDALLYKMEQALDKNGPMPQDPVRMGAIVVEEACEALAEAMVLTKPSHTASHRGATGSRSAMIHELLQCAGCAIAAARELGAQIGISRCQIR